MCGNELDMTAIEAAFYDDEGINYMAFLEHIEDSGEKKDINEVNKKAHFERLKEKQQNIEDLECCSKDPKEVEDLQQLLLRFKSKVFLRFWNFLVQLKMLKWCQEKYT